MDNEFMNPSDKQRLLRFAVKASAAFVCILLLVTLAVVFAP